MLKDPGQSGVETRRLRDGLVAPVRFLKSADGDGVANPVAWPGDTWGWLGAALGEGGLKLEGTS